MRVNHPTSALTREGTGDVTINLHNFLNGGGFHEGRGDPLLYGQDDALRGLDTWVVEGKEVARVIRSSRR